MLRRAFFRSGLPGGFAAAASSLAAAGGVTSVSRSPSSSASCSATSAASRSERFPKIMSLNVCIATRGVSFSASSTSTISVRAAGSVGVGANRHDQTIHPCDPCSSEILTSQPTMAGCFTGLGDTRVHSSPRVASQAASH